MRHQILMIIMCLLFVSCQVSNDADSSQDTNNKTWQEQEITVKKSANIKPFTSDGCSLFPDRNWIGKSDWLSCCFDHDVAYWQGGTEAQREQADHALKVCVTDKTNNEKFAELMYRGVRAGGSPYFYNWYRWGYGWSYSRKYGALTKAEQLAVSEAFDQYNTDKQTKN
jgi:hypothetical protein